MNVNSDRTALTGALFVLLAVIGYVVLGGDTPDGDASGPSVVAYYSDHGNREIFAAVVLALSCVPLVFFSILLRNRIRPLVGEDSVLATGVLAGGLLGAAGLTVAASIHFSLGDYADNVGPVAALAVNAIDSDFFLAYTTGFAIFMLAAGLATIRSRIFPGWMGWFAIVMFVAFFTPVGFIAFALTGIWIIATSVMLYRGAGLRENSASAPAAS